MFDSRNNAGDAKAQSQVAVNQQSQPRQSAPPPQQRAAGGFDDSDEAIPF